jgi:nucleotide-binding universal stress UspA family protein
VNSSKVVMVPLDGSPAGEVALPWAVELAKRTQGTVRLVGVHAPPAVLLDGETLVGSVIPDEPIREREKQYFEAVQERLRESGTAVAADLLDGGVITSLAEYARELMPAWVAMLCHSRGRLARFFVGETASEFVRESPAPVLLIHPNDSAGPTHVKRVLVPLDGSSLAEKVLGPAAELASAFGTGITLLKVGQAGAADNPIDILSRPRELLKSRGVSVNSQVLSGKSAAEAIAAEANREAGTIVALSTHARSGLSKLVWGSVTDEVVRRTTGPVLVLRSEEG